MNVPLLDLRAQLDYLEEDLITAVTRVVRSTCYIQGPEVEELEKEIAQYCGTSFGIGVTSGTDALLVSLMSLDIGVGDKVLTTPYSFFATMGVILRLGAEPVFADIDPVSYNIDPERMAELLAEDDGRTIKAIIPVHLYGQCAPMDEIITLAEQYDIPVIEDAAQAIGARYPSKAGELLEFKRAGAMGLAGCYSFFPSKNLGGIGDGGMVVTGDEQFAKKLVLMRNHGAYPKYYHEMVGGNFRLDPIQAAALRVKMPYLERWHEKRRQNSARYNKLFAESGLISRELVQPPVEVYRTTESSEQTFNPTHIYNQYVIRVRQRDELRDWLLKNGIGCEIYYPVPLHRQQCLGAQAGVSLCPQADKAAATTLALPVYPELTEEMQTYVVEKVTQFYA